MQMFTSTESTSWLRHAGGAARLMQIRGAGRHSTGLDYLMFLTFRGAIVRTSHVYHSG